MRIFFDRNVPSRYIRAIRSRPWSEVQVHDDRFDQATPDRRLVAYAETNGLVIFTRDDDFFALDPDCGLLYLAPNRRPSADEVARAVVEIKESYDDHAAIVESVPGAWV